MLEYEWTFVISRRMSQTRKNWSAVYFDPHVLRKLGSKMTEIKLQTVMTHVNGAYYTKDFMAKFLPDCDKLCPWCDQLDSIEHRGKCKHAMQSSKTFLPSTFFDQWDNLFLQHAIHPLPQEIWEFYISLPSLAGLEPKVPPRDLTRLHMYTDGSCTDPRVQLVKLSAGAVNKMQGDFDSIPINAKIVPGQQQSSARGELFAAILALEAGYNITIYTDYQLLCDRLHDQFPHLLLVSTLTVPKLCVKLYRVPVYCQVNEQTSTMLKWGTIFFLQVDAECVVYQSRGSVRDQRYVYRQRGSTSMVTHLLYPPRRFCHFGT